MSERSFIATIVKAAYDASPEYDCGEAIDGFQVTPGGALSWSQWCEANPDIAADFERRVIAGLRVACPRDPSPEVLDILRETFFLRHIYQGYTEEVINAEREQMRRLDTGDVRAIYRAQPLWRELWGTDE